MIGWLIGALQVVVNVYINITYQIIYMKKLLNSNWLRAVQLFLKLHIVQSLQRN
jgi:hypothetical protein